MALALADTRYKYPGARDEAIRHQLGMSTTQWAQVLDVLIDTAEAEAAYPMLVKRLRRLREARGAVRALGA